MDEANWTILLRSIAHGKLHEREGLVQFLADPYLRMAVGEIIQGDGAAGMWPRTRWHALVLSHLGDCGPLDIKYDAQVVPWP